MKPAALRFEPVSNPYKFDRAKVIAAPELQSSRLAICEPCQFNANGNCKQCCGGVPIPTLVNLTASRCGRGKW